MKEKKAHALLIINLAISDTAYSLYLIAIAVADAYYSGAYIIYDDWWRTSFLCKALSFLSIFSNELSMAALMCVSIDRYVTIFNGARKGMTMSKKRFCTIMLAMSWSVALLISLLPALLNWLLGETADANNSICIMLDMSTSSHYKSIYLICVYVLLNGMNFVCIIILYAQIINLHVQSSRKVGRKINMQLFKRTLLIVLVNFLSWAPLTVYLLLSVSDVATSIDVTVWMAIVILPINSAANPVVYTLSAACKSKTGHK